MLRRCIFAALAAAVACALFAAFGAASVNVAQSGWSWGNPTPQGNTLSSIDFVKGRGFAAGDAGTVLRTDDGGSTWVGLSTGTAADLSRLQVLDPDTLTVLASNGCVLRRSDDAGKSFHKIFIVAEQNCAQPVEAFTFVDRQTGYLVLRDGSILRTSDAGQTFSRQTAVPGTDASNAPNGRHAAEIAFTGADTGMVFLQPGNGPLAYSTTDGGISWKPIDSVAGNIRRVWFLDAQTGYAVGQNTLLETTDGGKTWKQLAGAENRDLTNIRCIERQRCILTTAPGDKLLRMEPAPAPETGTGTTTSTTTTTDTPAEAPPTITEITPSSQAIFAAAYNSTTRVTAVGATGATVISDDGGANYTPISNDIGGQFKQLRSGPVTGMAFALGLRGSLAITTDSGATWKTLAVPSSQAIADVSFADANDGYALDGRGGLYKTANAGKTWQTLDTGTTALPTGIAAPAADVILVVGPNGVRRAEGAAQPTLVGGKQFRRTPLDTVVSHQNLLVAYGEFGRNIFLSTDQGKTWKTVSLPKKDRLFGGRAADFVTPKIGMFIDISKRLWRTSNGGKTWKPLTSIGTDSISSVSMGDSASALIAVFPFTQDTSTGESAYVLRTSDGGKTWRPQAITRGRLTAAVGAAPQQPYAVGGLQGYALVDENHLFFSTSGGDQGTPTTITLRTSTKVFSVKAFKKSKGRVTVSGTIPGAVGGERVVVSRRDANGTRWSHQLVTAGANGGSFTTSWKIKRSSLFVAQWAGDSGRRGAGSNPLAITVKTPPKKVRKK